jgi:hypothetical protein
MLDLKDISNDCAMNSSGNVKEARRYNHVEGEHDTLEVGRLDIEG